MLALGGLALAHSGATGIVKERMDMMESIAGQMKAVGAMIKGEEVFAADKVSAAAEIIAGHSDRIPELFPDGSTEHPSKARTAIWTDWDNFLSQSRDMKTKAQALGDAARKANTITDIRPEFAALGKSCVSCHEDYRQPD